MVSMMPETLTDSEHLVTTAFQRGMWVDLRAGDSVEDNVERGKRWPNSRKIRAEVVTALLLGAMPAQAGFAAGIRIRGAHIVGLLDVSGAHVTCPLVLEQCFFDSEVRFVEATTGTIRLVGCWLPEFDGSRMRTDGIINLAGSTISRVLSFDRAKATGEVCLSGAVVGSVGGEVAVTCDGLVVEGPLQCNAGFSVHGVMQLRNAVIGGRLDLSESVLSNPGSIALRAGNARVDGAIDATCIQVEGEFRLIDAQVAGWMSLRGAQLRNAGGRALAAGGIAIEGGLWCHDNMRAEGEVRLIGARLGGNLSLTGATLANPGGIALNLDRATLTDIDGTGLTVTGGSVRFAGARTTGQVGLMDARLDPGVGQDAVNGDGASIGGHLLMHRLHAAGTVSLRTSRIGGQIWLIEAALCNPGHVALRLSRSEVAVDLLCGDSTIAGTVKLTGARVGSYVNFNGVRLSEPGGVAFDATMLRAATLDLRPAKAIEGLVDLRRAKVDQYVDDPSIWPEQLAMDGFSYGSLEPHLPALDRLRWLERDPQNQQSQQYEQLAADYNALGQGANARTVLYAKERREHADRSALGRIWGTLQDVTVGYGYRPWRAVIWMLVFLASGSITFALVPPIPLVAGQAPHFNPVIYTLDLLLPVVDLGQKHEFNPAGALQWFSYALIAAGWILATTVARAAARSLGRG
jgi:hypothetical protein